MFLHISSVAALYGHMNRYDKLSVYSDIVATQATRLELDVAGEGGRGWRRTGQVVETGAELGEAWCEDVHKGCQHLLTETWVPANVRASILSCSCCLCSETMWPRSHLSKCACSAHRTPTTMRRRFQRLFPTGQDPCSLRLGQEARSGTLKAVSRRCSRSSAEARSTASGHKIGS